jgi:hypothetical protein
MDTAAVKIYRRCHAVINVSLLVVEKLGVAQKHVKALHRTDLVFQVETLPRFEYFDKVVTPVPQKVSNVL